MSATLEELSVAMNELSGTEFKMWILMQFYGIDDQKGMSRYGVSSASYYNGQRKVRALVKPVDSKKRANEIRKKLVEAIIAMPDEVMLG